MVQKNKNRESREMGFASRSNPYSVTVTELSRNHIIATLRENLAKSLKTKDSRNREDRDPNGYGHLAITKTQGTPQPTPAANMPAEKGVK